MRAMVVRSLAFLAFILNSLYLNAAEFQEVLDNLDEHQAQLLETPLQHEQPAQIGTDIHSLNSEPNQAGISLVRFQFTADSNMMQGSTFELGAHYGEFSKEITLKTPLYRAHQFKDAIRVRSRMSPEKLIDKMVIDGAVSFNLVW